MQPKVSIIIPAFNVEKYLVQCLDSVINQTIKDIEIICVDDGSTDSTGIILDHYKLLDDRIVVIHRENGGLSIARNTGIEVAKGEYLGFVDSDDFVDVEMFELLYNSAKQHDSDVVITNLHLYMNKTKEILPYRDIVQLFHYERDGKFYAKQNPGVVKLIGVWDKLYRRDFIEKYKLRNPEKRIYEDALFTYQSLILAENISVVSQPLYYYRKDVGNAITDKEITNDNYKNDFLLNLKDIRAFMNKQKVYDSFCVPFLEYQFEFGLFHQSNIRSFNYFQIFFQQMQEMMLENDYQTIYNHGLSRHQWYAQRLQKRELKECYHTLRQKQISIYDL